MGKFRDFFPSIEELEEHVAQSKKNMDACIANRDFAGAEKLHANLERLQNRLADEKLKEAEEPKEPTPSSFSLVGIDGEKKEFDSRHDLEEAIKESKIWQNDAISAKQFKKAEAFQRLIESMENPRQLLPTVDHLK